MIPIKLAKSSIEVYLDDFSLRGTYSGWLEGKPTYNLSLKQIAHMIKNPDYPQNWGTDRPYHLIVPERFIEGNQAMIKKTKDTYLPPCIYSAFLLFMDSTV